MLPKCNAYASLATHGIHTSYYNRNTVQYLKSIFFIYTIRKSYSIHQQKWQKENVSATTMMDLCENHDKLKAFSPIHYI